MMTVMKHKIFLFVCIFLFSFSMGLFAQSGASTKTIQEILMSHKWYPDIYDEDDEEMAFRIYTKNQSIDSVKTEEGKWEVYVNVYYLSDTMDEVFNKDRIDKATNGQYIILSGNEELGIRAFILKLIEVSEEKLVVQHLTPGMSIYGHINTCYADSPKEDR